MLAQVGNRRLWRIQQMDCGRHDLIQIVRGNIGGHTDSNTGRAVKEQIGHLRREYGRFIQGAVEIRLPIHRALGQLREQYVGVCR